MMRDLHQALRGATFWKTYAINDLKKPYRNTYFGLLWVVVAPLAFILFVAPLYAGLFGVDLGTYLRHLALGYVFWIYMQQIVLKGPKIFASNKSILLQGNIPLSSLALRSVFSELIKLFCGLLIVFSAFLLTREPISTEGFFLFLLSTFIIVFLSFWISLLLGFLALVVPDLKQILPLAMRLAFFATPIIWMERDLGRYGEILSLVNPFNHALALVRGPLEFGVVDFVHFYYLFAVGAVIIAACFFAISRLRKRVGYLI